MRWVDTDWPATLERSLDRLWEMYEKSNNARVHEKEQNDKLVEDLMIKKNELQKKHNKLIKDSNAWFDALEKKLVLENMEKIKKEGGEEGSGSEIEALKNDMSRMKTEAEEQQREREVQYNALKEEKKNIEYKLFDCRCIVDFGMPSSAPVRQ